MRSNHRRFYNNTARSRSVAATTTTTTPQHYNNQNDIHLIMRKRMMVPTPNRNEVDHNNNEKYEKHNKRQRIRVFQNQSVVALLFLFVCVIMALVWYNGTRTTNKEERGEWNIRQKLYRWEQHMQQLFVPGKQKQQHRMEDHNNPQQLSLRSSEHQKQTQQQQPQDENVAEQQQAEEKEEGRHRADDNNYNHHEKELSSPKEQPVEPPPPPFAGRQQQQEQQQQEQPKEEQPQEQQTQEEQPREEVDYEDTEESRLQTKWNKYDAKVREIKKRVKIFETDKEAQRVKTMFQEITRHLLHERYGPNEPYRIELFLDFSASDENNNNNNKLVLEMGPTRNIPVSVFYFMELARRYRGGAFHRNAAHVLQAYVEDGGNPLSFQEYSYSFPHRKATVGYAGRPSGPDWYISIEDNTMAHGPGSQQDENPYEADSCFGTVVSGFYDVVPRMQQAMGRCDDFCDDPRNEIRITNMTILVPDDSNEEEGMEEDSAVVYKQWKPPNTHTR